MKIRILALFLLLVTASCATFNVGAPSGEFMGSTSSGSASSTSSPPPRKLGAPILTFAGDLAGTMQSQTVAGVKGITVPTPTGTNTVLTYNAGAYSWGSGSGFTAGGDLAGTSTSQQVTGLTGSAGVVMASAGTIRETGSTLTVTDSVGVSRDVLDMAHGRITAGGGGSDLKAVCGPLTGGETSWAACAFLPTATAASSTNYAFLGNGTDTYMNAPTGNVFVSNGGTGTVQIGASTINFLRPTSLVWAASIVAPNLSQSAATSDVAAQNLSIQAQAPYVSAVTNATAADVVVNTAPSVGGGSKYGGFQVAYNTSTMVDMGSYANGNNAAIWIKVAPSTANFSFLGDGTNSVVNAPSGFLALRVANNTILNVATSGVTVGTTASANSIAGSAAYTTRSVTASFTIDTTTKDHTIGIDTTAGVVTVTLPAPTAGRHLHLVNVAGSWNTHNVTLARHGTEKINNTAASKTLTGNNGVTTVYECDVDSLDGVDWYTSCSIAGARGVVPLGGGLIGLAFVALLVAQRRRSHNDHDERMAA